MKKLSDLSALQLNYLKQKMSVEKIELDREVVRSQARLNNKVNKQAIDSGQVALLKTNLDAAERLLQHLKASNAPADMINAQQISIDALKLEYTNESVGLNVLTDEEAYLNQIEIEELKLRRDYRTGKITEIDDLLAA